jgi:hypothetical protein
MVAGCLSDERGRVWRRGRWCPVKLVTFLCEHAREVRYDVFDLKVTRSRKRPATFPGAEPAFPIPLVDVEPSESGEVVPGGDGAAHT